MAAAALVPIIAPPVISLLAEGVSTGLMAAVDAGNAEQGGGTGNGAGAHNRYKVVNEKIYQADGGTSVVSLAGSLPSQNMLLIQHRIRRRFGLA